jgi:hypothetical protein
MIRRSVAAFALVLAACGGEATSSPIDAGPDAPDGGARRTASVAEAITIDEVAAYQALKLSWWSATPVSSGVNVPLLREKPALVRAFVRVGGKKKWTPRELVAELHLSGAAGEKVLTATKVVSGTSTEAELGSTFTFALGAGALEPGATAWLVVRDPAEADPKLGQVRAPKSGAVEPSSAPVVGRLKIVVVPVRYLADGDAKLPHTAPEDLQALHDELYDMFPVADVTIGLHAPWDWSGKLDANGGGWAALLVGLRTLRAGDAPEKDVYYVAAVTPATSWLDYCPNGCVAGMASSVVQLGAIQERAVAVLGFGSTGFAETSAHELGHAHGRAHAPCGNPANVDQLFPYSGGSTGVPGYRMTQGELVPDAVDVMSYCAPVWVSDYTYDALRTRIAAVAAQDVVGTAPEATFVRWFVDADGSAKNTGTLRERMPDAPAEVRTLRIDGELRPRKGWWSPLDHASGGFFYVLQ